jgi:Terpene synthase family 2, C-terminal metal binding
MVLVVPEIECPFPGTFHEAQNPAAADVARRMYAQLTALGVWEEVEPVLAGVDLVHHAGRIYPEVSATALELVAWYFAVFFVHDDWMEQRDGGGLRTAAEVSRAHDCALRVLDGAPSAGADPAFVTMTGPLRRALAAGIRSGTWNRFRDAFEQWLRAHPWELDYRRRGVCPPLAVYPKLRREVSGVRALLELHPDVFPCELPARFARHPAIRQIQTMVVNYAVWANDVFSLAKELAEGSTCNLVLVLCAELGVEPQAGVDTAVRMIARELDAYRRLRASLPAVGVGPADDLTAFLDRQERWIADGALAWHRGLPRYTEPGRRGSQ